MYCKKLKEVFWIMSVAVVEINCSYNIYMGIDVPAPLRIHTCTVASESNALIERWKWSRPDVRVYTSLVRGLAASLRVSDALRMIADICRVGVSPGEEV